MKPLSAVALCVFLILVAMTRLAWITASPKVLGWVGLIAAIVILLDTFVFRSERWVVRRGPQA